MTTHPDYPSLAALSDILRLYKVQNVGVSVPFDKIQELPVPFIAHLNDLEKLQTTYGIVTEVNMEKQTCLLGVGRRFKIYSFVEFSKKWTGKALIVNKTGDSKEPWYYLLDAGESWNHVIKYIKILVPVAYFIVAFHYSFSQSVFPAVAILSILSIKSIGLFAVFALLAKDFSLGSSGLIDHFCKVGGLNPIFNCDNVLRSGASSVFGFKMSEIGLFYFCGTLLIILFTSIQSNVELQVEALFFVNLLTIPYIFFSVFYQIFIIRSVCVLCMTTQFILAFEFLILVNLQSGELVDNFFELFGLFAICFGIPLLYWLILRPSLETTKEYMSGLKRLNYFLYDKETVDMILSRSRLISTSSLPNDIVIGNQKGIVDITAVINPYCKHCAKEFEQLYNFVAENSEAKLTLRLVGSGASEFRTISLMLFQMRIDNNTAVLSNWFRQNWDYEKLKSKVDSGYNLDGLTSIVDGMAAVQKWIQTNEIRSTPAIIINGRMVPNGLRFMDFFFYLKNLT